MPVFDIGMLGNIDFCFLYRRYFLKKLAFLTKIGIFKQKRRFFLKNADFCLKNADFCLKNANFCF